MKKPAIIVVNVAKKEKKSTVSRSKILFRITGFPVNWIPDKRFRTVFDTELFSLKPSELQNTLSNFLLKKIEIKL